MGDEKTLGSYEIGYGKPPKNTQFQKGISGNPRGRPKKSLGVDHALIRESKSLMTINENGRGKRISKHEVAIKQLMKLAMTGSTPALRIYFGLHQQAHERVALVAGPQPNNSGKYDPKHLTDEELMRMIAAAGLEKTEQESGKGHVSNTD
jgi:Family of unknown function (DUF5681)